LHQSVGLALFVLALVWVTRQLTRRVRLAVVLLGIVVPLAIAIPVLRESSLPHDLSEVSYDTSDGCRRCHFDHHDSWHRSYHRTMTQPASAETIQGDFDDVSVTFYDVTSRLFRDGDEFFMETVDPEWARFLEKNGVSMADAGQQRLVTWRIDLAIGSHNYQQYATALDSGTIVRLPLAWHIGERRWVHMNGVFLEPESSYFHQNSALWNDNCIFCHNVKGQPRLPAAAIGADPRVRSRLPFETRVEEYGIACEACHGPGDEHARAHQNVARRLVHAMSDRPDPTIVNPARLSKERSAQVCGHCHSLHLPRPEFAVERIVSGDPYTAGEDFEQYVHFQVPGDFRDGSGRLTFESNYWPDGTIRRTSIEYLGLIESPCYQRGEMTCLSCHQLHADDPDDQLAPGMRTNLACTGCHPSYTDEETLTAHTNHPGDSSGSSCYNCHMPYVVWGLLRGIRSHRVITPSVGKSIATGMPNPCTQCHLDRTLGWALERTQAWYGEPSTALDGDEATTVASLVHLLRGDAAQRALAAWSFGWSDARAASTTGWAPRFLLLAMEDDYAAIRLAAFRSLKRQAVTTGLPFDYLSSPEVRAAQIAAIRSHLGIIDDAAGHTDAAGELDVATRTEIGRADDIPDPAAARALLARRDDRPLHISE